MVYTKTLKHSLELVQLPKGETINVSTKHMIELVVDVCAEVKQKLGATSAKYKKAVDKHHRHEIF